MVCETQAVLGERPDETTVRHAFRRADGPAPRRCRPYQSLCGEHSVAKVTGLACLRPAARLRCQACDRAEAALLGPKAKRRGAGAGRPYRWHGNHEKCPTCSLTYGRLRTGLTYSSVFEMIMDGSEDASRWTYKRRGKVMGVWHALKQAYWRQHQVECREAKTAAVRAKYKARGYLPRRFRKAEQRALVRAALSA